MSPRDQSPFIHLRADSKETLQRQLYEAVRRAILDGTLPPGSRLTSSRSLATQLGVSRTTALLAFDQLAAEGYLTGRHGSGTFVATDLPDAAPVTPVRVPARASRPPRLSRRGRRLAALPPNALRVAGGPVAFRLGVPALDLFPSALWARLVAGRWRDVASGTLDYGMVAGLERLRVAIAHHLCRSRGAVCTADEIVITAGAQRAVELVAHAVLDPGDEAWIESPGYSGAVGAAVAAGAIVRHAAVGPEGLDVDALARAGAKARLVYVTPSHQFPLGVAMPLSRRAALLRWAAATGAWIVEDDYDNEFRFTRRPMPCLQGLDVDGRVVYVGSFSKTLFPSLRLGFLVAPAALRELLLRMRRIQDLHPPALDQLVLADFIEGGHFERHLRRMRAVYRERADAVAESAERCGSGLLTVRPIHAGLHAVADLVGDVDARDVAERACKRGIEVMPVSHYMPRPPARDRSLVLGFGAVRPEALARAMSELVAVVESAPSRRSRRVSERAPQ
jgi:GntR family transcriptional regulator / MocR family aminotransferase